MRSLIVIFAILIVGVIFIVVWDLSLKPTIDQTNYNEISWRLPLDNEIKKMKESFLHSDIDLCAHYFIKKYEGEKYLIACDSGNGSWTYYTAYATEHKVYLTSLELTSNLLPPETPTENSIADPKIPHPKVQNRSVPTVQTIEAK